MPEALQQLRRGLLRESGGGDRALAQMLAIVPAAGLDAVLVAVALALANTARYDSLRVQDTREVGHA